MKGKFLSGCMVLAVPGLALAEPVSLTITNGLSPTHIVSTHGFEPWMACVTERTGGEVTFNYFPGGQIASVKESTDSLAAGLADVAFISPSNEGSKLPLNAIAMLPGGGNSAGEITAGYRRAIDAGGPLADELTGLNILPILLNSLPPYQIMARNLTIDTAEKFGGVKARVAGGAMTSTAMALGAVPVEMQAGEIYIAMERGTVDATISALSSVKTYSLQELVTSMSINASLGTSTQFFGISLAAWERLTAPQQEAVMGCGAEVEVSLAKALDDGDAALREEFAGLGIELFEFSAEELAKIQPMLEAAAQDYVDRVAERGLPAQEVFDLLRQPATN